MPSLCASSYPIRWRERRKEELNYHYFTFFKILISQLFLGEQSGKQGESPWISLLPSLNDKWFLSIRKI